MNSVVQMRAVNILVESVCVIVSAGEIDGSDTKFRSDKRDVGKRTLRSFKALVGDINLEVGIRACW